LGKVDDAAYQSCRDLIENAAKLDRFHIPTRYPNGLPDITPDQAYFKEDAESAIAIAEAFRSRVEAMIAG
jgi:HEPN domain-containing protein